jgi:transcriptional regulator with GAF, ATPase, and Fis domain
VDAENQVQRKFLWIPSSAPDLCERRLWDRLSRFSPAVCRTEQQAVDAIHQHGTSVALANGPAEAWDPTELLTALQAECPSTLFFLRDIRLSISKAVQLARKGAAGVFGQEADEMTVAGEVESALRRNETSKEYWRRNLIGTSAAIEQICATVALVSQRRGTVLLRGETGSGKEVLARAIHAAGKRAKRPFVAVNCSAIPGTLLESELFGHVRGAFTGAHSQRIGRFEQAHSGTLFLDEIGDLDIELQSKLLRVLQERELQRLGSSDTVRLDVRVIAATHIDLTQRIREGSFREDLYYRLNVIPIEVPPLRARKSDVPLLAEHILRKICLSEEIPLRSLTGSALMLLMEYSWPGNIRELENTLERAVALSGDRLVLSEQDFDLPSDRVDVDSEMDCEMPDGGFDYERAVSRFEWNLLSKALRKSGGNKKAAADLLGLKRTTLAAKVRVLSTTTGSMVM